MKPWCHNRPDREEVGRWVDTGRVSPANTFYVVKNTYRPAGRYMVFTQRPTLNPRPVLRYRRAFHDINACMAYTVPEGTVPAPVRDGWTCDGCRFLPKIGGEE